MTSAVQICNEALSHLGEGANVSSIDPPEGSAHAEHCALFYPSTLATLLELHDWKFASRRATLAEVTNTSTAWAFAYAVPNLMVRARSVLAVDAPDDYSALGQYTPQSFEIETEADGSLVVRTNQEDAVLRYTVLVEDPVKFSPLFVEALGWLLASKLAGPVLKGKAGREAALSCNQTFAYWFAKAAGSDANQRKNEPEQNVAWMVAR